jgi:hypothetical protein
MVWKLESRQILGSWVFYTKFNEAEDDDGCFKFRNSQFLNLKKISHDIETNLMSNNTLFFQVTFVSISLLLWKDKNQRFFQHRISFSVQPPDYNKTSHVTTHATHSDPWPTLAPSNSLFLICCYNYQHLYLLLYFSCLSSRNMIDKTMCEVLWRNISDFYVNLRVEVAKLLI